nr:immunoglobulin light chain junction region [Macaca mulatta]MOX86886.1 immunoglobulin light chain junction region [Macaca mulatta]MOX87112.1 immunoglobulin light chain junction region [Macaca mulatta]MOX87348.1 immunoglobulin light chain junction region [Macaca mulatta]MOX88426.1 immunoglobulin light chain junction region [Macaca mulatta]
CQHYGKWPLELTF